MAVQIRIIGEPIHIEIITRDLRAVYRVIGERTYPSRRNPAQLRRYLTIATERVGEFGPEPAEGFRE